MVEILKTIHMTITTGSYQSNRLQLALYHHEQLVLVISSNEIMLGNELLEILDLLSHNSVVIVDDSS